MKKLMITISMTVLFWKPVIGNMTIFGLSNETDESVPDTIRHYQMLQGGYEYYRNDRYSRLTLYLDDKRLMADERGYPHLHLRPVDFKTLRFRAEEGKRKYTFRFIQGDSGAVERCIWTREDEVINAVRDVTRVRISPMTPEELEQDFAQLKRILEQYHPLLHAFADKAAFERICKKQGARFIQPMTMEEFYRTAIPVVESVGCGHTNLWMPEGWLSQSLNTYFPLKLRFIGNEAYILQKNAKIPMGSRILSINGVRMPEIRDRIISAISADGYNRNYKLRRMEMMFPFQFAKQFGTDDQFIVRYRPYNAKRVEKAYLQPADFPTTRRNIVGESILDFRIHDDGKTAILSINHFDYYRNRAFYTAFIDSCFRSISEKKIHNLVLNLRGNSGGDPFSAAHLFSYLEKKPASYFSTPFGKYKKLAAPIPPAANRFRGNLFVLIDGLCFSTTGHLCALLRYHGLGIFVGEETGGTYTCNDGKAYLHLKHTRIQFWVATLTAAAAVEGLPPDRGIEPDYALEQSVEDELAGRDTVLAFTLALIEKSYSN